MTSFFMLWCLGSVSSFRFALTFDFNNSLFFLDLWMLSWKNIKPFLISQRFWLVFWYIKFICDDMDIWQHLFWHLFLTHLDEISILIAYKTNSICCRLNLDNILRMSQFMTGKYFHSMFILWLIGQQFQNQTSESCLWSTGAFYFQEFLIILFDQIGFSFIVEYMRYITFFMFFPFKAYFGRYLIISEANSLFVKYIWKWMFFNS